MNPVADPFGEAPGETSHVEADVLGARCTFSSDSPRLLELVEQAFGRLPAHRLSAQRARFRIALRSSGSGAMARSVEPAAMRLNGANGLLCGALDAANLAVVDAQGRRALVVLSETMVRRYPYHARYELLEFAVYTLLARGQGLVPLHAACVAGSSGAILLVGDSGAGKSTLSLHALRCGMQFVSEDSTFVSPSTLKTTGVATYLHLRDSSLRFIDASERTWIRNHPRIRRRSGVEKFEIDVRGSSYEIARSAPRLRAIVMLSAQKPAKPSGRLLSSLSARTMARLLEESQPYAARQPSWRKFLDRVPEIGCFKLLRGAHPDEGVEQLLRLV